MSKLNLVTGANGHLGNNLVRALLEKVRSDPFQAIQSGKNPFEREKIT